MKTQSGHTLVELMIAVTLSALMVVGVSTVFLNQGQVIQAETQREEIDQEAQTAFDIVSRLLRQAEQGSVQVNYGSGRINAANEAAISNDRIDISLRLPAGYPIWPNNVAAPYANNFVRISWWGDNSDQAYTLGIENGPSLAALNGSNRRVIAGSSSETEIRIVNVDLWPLDASGNPQVSPLPGASFAGYQLKLTTRSGSRDISYQNPAIQVASEKNYRTQTVAAVVSPRN